MDIFAKKPKKIALVLGGGSARGLAHIGALKVFEREEIPINLVVGTSMGALVGACYATGIPVVDMEKIASRVTWGDLFDPTLPTMSLLEGKKMAGVINELLKEKTFLDARMPLAVVTTDIEKGEQVIYTSGDLQKIVRASCSWPGIFNPVKLDGKLLVDGGIKNSVPVAIARGMGADFVIAIDVGFCVTKDEKIQNIFRLILQSFQIIGEELNTYQSRDANIIIEPELGKLDQAAFDKSVYAMQKGQEAAENALPLIRKKLGLKPRRFAAGKKG